MKNGATIGSMNYDGLLIDGKHSPDVKGVTYTQTANAEIQEVSDESTMKASKAYASGDIIHVGDDYYTADSAIAKDADLASSGGSKNVTALTVSAETDFIAASGYSANDYFTLNGNLYKVKSSISAGGTIYTDTDDFPAYTIKRGTLLSVSGSDASVLISGATPDCILADDLEVTTSRAYEVAAYKSGNFNKNMLEEIVGLALSDANIETLRTKGIFVESVME